MSSIITEPTLAHHVGETVKIRSRDYFEAHQDEDGVAEFDDGGTVLPSMLAFAGKSARITRIDPFGEYELDIDSGEYGWADSLLEGLCPACGNADDVTCEECAATEGRAKR
jgi:hypothetical protein